MSPLFTLSAFLVFLLWASQTPPLSFNSVFFSPPVCVRSSAHFWLEPPCFSGSSVSPSWHHGSLQLLPGQSLATNIKPCSSQQAAMGRSYFTCSLLISPAISGKHPKGPLLGKHLHYGQSRSFFILGRVNVHRKHHVRSLPVRSPGRISTWGQEWRKAENTLEYRGCFSHVTHWTIGMVLSQGSNLFSLPFCIPFLPSLAISHSNMSLPVP